MWIISMLVSDFGIFSQPSWATVPVGPRGASLPAPCPTACPLSESRSQTRLGSQPRSSTFRHRPHLRGSGPVRVSARGRPGRRRSCTRMRPAQARPGRSNGLELPPPEVGDGASGGAGCSVAAACFRLRVRAARASLSASWQRPPTWCGCSCSWATRCCGSRCSVPGRPPRPRR